MATAQTIHAESPRRGQDPRPGEVLLQANLSAEALPHLLAAAQAEPQNWGHQVNLCIAYRKLGQYEESRQHIVRATQLAPEQWPVYHAWGSLLDEVGKFSDALDARLAAWDLCQHQNQLVAFALAWSLLRKGDWLNAWPLYEAGRFMRSWQPPPGLPNWRGEPVQGKRLLLMSEGGYGDTFMFSRWIPNLHGSGCDVTLYVWDKQIPLLRTSPELDGIKFLPMSSEIDTRDYDFVSSVMSLPAIMQATPDTLPPSITFNVSQSGVYVVPSGHVQTQPFKKNMSPMQGRVHENLAEISPFESRTAQENGLPRLRSCLSQEGTNQKSSLREMRKCQISDASSRLQQASLGGLALPSMSSRPTQRRIGICWSAEEFGVPRKMRSLPAQRVEVLSGIEAEWYSLVPGQTLTWMQPCHGNWLDDARLIKSLDTVISCDTSVLHLAGCLGVPTIGMLPVYSSWTWMSERSDTPWYPAVRLVRGKKPDQWEETIAEVRGMLNGQE